MTSFICIFPKAWVLLYSLLLIQPIFTEINLIPEDMMIEYNPIGIFHSQLTPQTGAPRQGVLKPEIKGKIEIYDKYSGALRGLEDFEYIIVIYHMHLSRHWHPDVRPPGSSRPFGLFATRSPNRPNPIGFAVIKLDGIEDQIIHVSGIDAFDGTPVLDIKPWLPSIDCPSSKSYQEIEHELGL